MKNEIKWQWIACVAPVFTLVLLSASGTIIFGQIANPKQQSLEKDLAYGADPKQRMDLSYPSGKAFSTIIFIHGGSLEGGDKADEDYGKVCLPFVEAGIACANVNYRLAPTNPWPAQIEDVAAALAWVHINIVARGGDPNKLFLMGHSSGAMLAALAATDEQYLAQFKLKTSSISGVVPMGSIMCDDDMEQAVVKYGRNRVEEGFGRDPRNKIFADLDTFLNIWPIHHVRPAIPPFLFLIADAEQTNPPVLKTNKKFVEAARALGNSAEYKVLAGRTHYSAIRKISETDDPTFVLVRDFVLALSSTVK